MSTECLNRIQTTGTYKFYRLKWDVIDYGDYLYVHTWFTKRSGVDVNAPFCCYKFKWETVLRHLKMHCASYSTKEQKLEEVKFRLKRQRRFVLPWFDGYDIPNKVKKFVDDFVMRMAEENWTELN